VRDEAIDDAEIIEEPEQQASANRRSANLPARQQDMIFPAPVTGVPPPHWPAT
jgi:hypothetical protein